MFFRQPGGASSDSSSDEAGSERLEDSQPSAGSILDPDVELATTESLSRDASLPDRDPREASEGPQIPNVDRHRDLMFATLLEEFCKTRAAELINTGSPGSNYHRLSPESQSLAQKLYQEASQALASNGFLPSSATSNKQSSVRGQYLTGLDNMSMRTIQDRDLVPEQEPDKLRADNMELVQARRRGSAEIIKSFDPQVGNIIRETSHMSISSPHSNVQMSYASQTRGHYESSFQQMRLLGKGGFGHVYHAYNIFDKKEYAVKKIPLSVKLSQRYKKSGHQELESVLREVQALAQLEHSNCVRYHACWVEEPKSPTSPPMSVPSPGFVRPAQRLLAQTPHLDKPSSTSDPESVPQLAVQEQSDDIVFGFDSTSRRTSREVGMAATGWSIAERTRDSSVARESEIFTDGQSRPATNQPDASIDHSVYVLHVQMSMYPLTLKEYLAPLSVNSVSAPGSRPQRHCFHLVPSLRILLGILCGLQYIHAKGLIHRDIKPGNIFLSTANSDDGIALSEGYWDVGSCPTCPDPTPYHINPRIGDFGLVAEIVHKAAEDSQLLGHGSSSRPVGTEFYRPPFNEANSRPAIDEKLDIFALGVILVEMLCAISTSSERMHVLKDMQDEKLPVELGVRVESEGHDAGTGKKVDACIRGMIKRDASVRWGCARVKEEVEEILHGCVAGDVIGMKMKKMRSLSGTETD